jgi:hypothetical protein
MLAMQWHAWDERVVASQMTSASRPCRQPIWTYGIQLWGTASTSNIEILERFQPKALLIIVDAPWYVPNKHIRRDLQMPSVKEEICRYSNQYYTRLTTHPNDQISTHMEIPGNRRLRRHVPNDLPDRFVL